jgi:hypothetical protein
MSDCCSSSCDKEMLTKKHKCPICSNISSIVSPETIVKHMNEPWNWIVKEQTYYFCDEPDCDVVYLGGDDSIIKQSQLRTTVGIKSKSINSLICYCFGVKRNEANIPKIKDFVIKKTRDKICACESLNPSGKCCLKDFPK